MRKQISRRLFTVSIPAFAAVGVLPAKATGATAIHVVKDPNCGCCVAWIAILQAEGFDVSQEHAGPNALDRYKRINRVPAEMASCHTATIDGYVIEGHVPVADIRRLLAERPDALGLAVPGMPYGSPGMGPESEREAFDVFLLNKDGSAEVFSSYPAA